MNLAADIEQHPGDRPALVSGDAVISYGELASQVAEMRGGLVARGVAPDDRVAIIAGNTWDFVASYLAVLGVGGVAVPLNPSSPPAEVGRELDIVEARLVVAGPIGPAADAVGRGDGPSAHQGIVPARELLGAAPAELVPRQPDDLAVLLFTSGTAGPPRPAMLTHGNLRANVDQILASPGRPRGPDEVVLGALPLFHVFGLNAVLGVALRIGASVVLIDHFDADTALGAIDRHTVTIVSGVPAMWAALAAAASADAASGGSPPLAGVHTALSGAAPLDGQIRRRVAQRLGLDLRQGYGLTEASPVVTHGVGGDVPEGSIGKPLVGVHVRLVDDQGRDVLVGDPGEIWVRGPNVFAGYWRDPGATAAVLTDDGWLRTGDVAVVDDDGFLYLVDRLKDVIIVSGFNVFPAEVEEVITAHPGVAAAAAVGVPHPQTGEAVRAVVVAGPGDADPVDEAEIVAWCRQHLARYKCPSSVSFVDELPAGLAGKVLRRSLR